MSRISASTSALGTAIGLAASSCSITCDLSRACIACASSRSMFSRTSVRSASMPPSRDAECFAEGGVHFGQRSLLDLLHGRLEARGLAGECFDRVLVRKAQVEFTRLAGGCAAHALSKSGSRRPAPSDDHEVLALAAIERLAVDAALEIERDPVAVLAAARDRRSRSGRCWRRLSIIVSTSRIRDGGCRARAAGCRSTSLQFELRVDFEGRGVAQVTGLRRSSAARCAARPPGAVFPGAGLGEGLADQVGDDFFLHLRPVVLAHDMDRRLARPEALDARRAADLQQARVHLLAHAVRRAPTPRCGVRAPVATRLKPSSLDQPRGAKGETRTLKGFPTGT